MIRGSSETPFYVAFAVIAIASLGLAYLALTGVHLTDPPSASTITSSAPSLVATSVAPAPTPTPVSTGVAVGLIGGSEGWWTASVGAGAVPGFIAGTRIGDSDSDIADLASQLAAVEVTAGQPVLVQAGTRDIVEGATGDQIDAAIQSLWQSVTDRGGRPIAVLIPPSNAFPGSVVAVNEIIRASALARGVAVLDITAAVTNVDGTWAAGYSDDGVQPNVPGTALMVQSVTSQLPGLIGPDAIVE